jgi:hypothetical protein
LLGQLYIDHEAVGVADAAIGFAVLELAYAEFRVVYVGWFHRK